MAVVAGVVGAGFLVLDGGRFPPVGQQERDAPAIDRMVKKEYSALPRKGISRSFLSPG
jgi:hypothetical protein